MKSFVVELLGDCLGFLTGLLMVFGALIGWIFFEVLQRVDAQEIKKALSWSLLIAFLSLGFTGVLYSIGGFFDWENSLYNERIPLKLFLGSITQIVPLFALMSLMGRMKKANMFRGDREGVISALFFAFLIVAILGFGGLIISTWWFISN